MKCQEREREWDKCYLCPYVDYDKATETEQYCLIRKEFVPNNKVCTVPVAVMVKYIISEVPEDVEND